MTVQEPDTPQISRVYNYVIGGDLHFEVDRQTAAKMMEILPAYPTWAKLNRQFLTWVAQQWQQEGVQHILDLGSGLPSAGHFHTVLPKAAILYTDNDRYAVSEGQKLISAYPNIRYEYGDLLEPEGILETASAFFGDKRDVAIGCIGVSYFLTDEQISNLAQLLYNWAAPGASIAVSHLELLDTPEGKQFEQEMYKRLAPMGLKTYWRTTEQIAALFAPWSLQKGARLEEWVERTGEITSADRVDDIFWMSGAVLVHG